MKKSPYAVKCQSKDVQHKWIIKDATPGAVHFSDMTRSKLSQTILLPSSHFAAGCTATSLKYFFFFFPQQMPACLALKVSKLQRKAQSSI